MSKSMLANPKAAVGFAGFVVVVAVVASFSADAFLPSSDPEPETVAVVEGEPAQVSQTAPDQARGSAWGGGGLSDSWSSSVSDGNAPAPDKQPGDVPGERSPNFNEYTPPSSSAPQVARNSSAGSGSGPKITSGAAPSAPPVSNGTQDAPPLVRQ